MKDFSLAATVFLAILVLPLIIAFKACEREADRKGVSNEAKAALLEANRTSGGACRQIDAQVAATYKLIPAEKCRTNGNERVCWQTQKRIDVDHRRFFFKCGDVKTSVLCKTRYDPYYKVDCEAESPTDDTSPQ